MAQFDVFVLVDGQMVVDCQADHFADIATRLVVPVEPVANAHRPQPRLDPIIDINGDAMMLLTQFATAVRAIELRKPVASIVGDRPAIVAAFDMLLTGV